jgi:hypothetical protein
MPVIDPALLKRARERIDRLMPMLSDVKARREWETEPTKGCNVKAGSAVE